VAPRTLSSIIKGRSRQAWSQKCGAPRHRWDTPHKTHRMMGSETSLRVVVQVEVPFPVPVPKNESHLRPNSRDLGFGCLIFLAVAFGFTWGSTWQSILSIFGQCPNWLPNNNSTVHTTYVCARGNTTSNTYTTTTTTTSLQFGVRVGGTKSRNTHYFAKSQNQRGLKPLPSGTKFMITCSFTKISKKTTLNMIFSVWLYLVLLPPYHVQH
jgi:hypothetical protein